MSARLPAPDAVLRQDHEALLRDNAALREQLTVANARIGALTTEIGRLAEAVARSNDRIGELVALAQNKRRPAGSSAPPPSPPIDTGEEARNAFANRPVAPVLPERTKPAKKPRRPTGRKPLPEHLPVDDHTRRPDACEHCGGTGLDLVDEVIEQKLHVVKEHQRCRRVCRKTGRCRACGGADHGAIAASTVSALESHMRVACVARPPEVRATDATRPARAGPRSARHPPGDELPRQPD